MTRPWAAPAPKLARSHWPPDPATSPAELAGQTLGPITVGYAIDPVNERTFSSPGTVTLGNFLLNATVAVNSNQTITTAGLHDVTTDSTLAAYSGIPSNGLSLTGGPDSITGTNATDSITRTISGTLATGTYYTQSHTFNMDATDELAGTVPNAAGVSYFVNVGNATAALSDRGGTNTANRLAYQMTSTQVGSQTLFNGTVLTAVVGNTGSYAGLASMTIHGGTVLGTEATILAGTNSSGSDRTVSMTWRDRSTLERSGGTTPPLPTSPGSQRFLISDVVLLTGMDSGPGTITDTNHSIPGNPYTITTHQTDDFVLQMSYSGGAAPTLDWLDPFDRTWKLASTPATLRPKASRTPTLANNASGWRSGLRRIIQRVPDRVWLRPEHLSGRLWLRSDHQRRLGGDQPQQPVRGGRRSARANEFGPAWIGSDEFIGPA